LKYRLTRRARTDVLQIWNYIAEDSEAAADRFVGLLIRHFELLGNNLYAGRARDELRDE
jgi:toxin ParE1/3/4